MTPTPFTAPELEPSSILLALSGDVTALARLYTSYHPLVLRVARHTLERLRLEDMPGELAAEVWLRLLDHRCRALRAFDPTRGSFRSFVKMVAWQHALAVARRLQRRARREGSFSAHEPFEPLTPCMATALHHRLLLCRMVATVPRLTPLDHTLLEESLLMRTPMQELASRLGHGVDTLYKRNAWLRARLRDAAQRIDHEPLSYAG